MSKEIEKIIMITIPLPRFPPYRGYLAIWCFKIYWYFYYCLVIDSFKNMRVGNIFDALLMPLKALIYAKDMVNDNLNHVRIMAYNAYKTLANVPL